MNSSWHAASGFCFQLTTPSWQCVCGPHCLNMWDCREQQRSNWNQPPTHKLKMTWSVRCQILSSLQLTPNSQLSPLPSPFLITEFLTTHTMTACMFSCFTGSKCKLHHSSPCVWWGRRMTYVNEWTLKYNPKTLHRPVFLSLYLSMSLSAVCYYLLPWTGGVWICTWFLPRQKHFPASVAPCLLCVPSCFFFFCFFLWLYVALCYSLRYNLALQKSGSGRCGWSNARDTENREASKCNDCVSKACCWKHSRQPPSAATSWHLLISAHLHASFLPLPLRC